MVNLRRAFCCWRLAGGFTLALLLLEISSRIFDVSGFSAKGITYSVYYLTTISGYVTISRSLNEKYFDAIAAVINQIDTTKSTVILLWHTRINAEIAVKTAIKTATPRSP